MRYKSNPFKYCLTLIIVISLIYSLVIHVFAYELWYGYKWSSSNIKYYYGSYNSSRAQYYMTVGANAWNPTDINYSFNSSCNVFAVEVYDPDEEWDGLTTNSNNGTYFTAVSIQLNKAQTYTWMVDGALQSVAIHEFGHALGLYEEESPANVIMNPYTWGNYSRYGYYGLIGTTADDISGANFLY